MRKNNRSPTLSPTIAAPIVTMPNTVKNEASRSFIPIRSITYKKSLADEKEFGLRKEMSGSISRCITTPGYSVQMTSPTRASTNYGSRLDCLSPATSTRPHMAQNLHKLSLGTSRSISKPSTAAAALPQVKNPKRLASQSTLNNYSMQLFENKRERIIKKVQNTTPQDDYFKLLFDENRKPFTVEDYDGVDEYYTDEHIMNRIYAHGFRDRAYYETKPEFIDDLKIMDEQSIKDEYRFKIPVLVSTMENNNTLAAHVLGGTWNNIKLIELSIANEARQIKIIKTEKQKLEKEVEEIKKRFEAEIENVVGIFSKKFEKLKDIIKEDFVVNQNENFKLQKEITLLQRDKLILENEILSCVPYLQSMDNVLYGTQVFNLATNEEGLGHIPNINLRVQQSSSMSNGPIIH